MTYNDLTKKETTLVDCYKSIYVDCALYPVTYAYLRSNNITYRTTGTKKTLIDCSAEVLNPCTGFNLTHEHLLNMIYYLVKEGNFGMNDLLKTDWFYANLFYEKLFDEIEKKRKQEEEENKRQEQEMANYQSMQAMQSKIMENMNQYMPQGGFN